MSSVAVISRATRRWRWPRSGINQRLVLGVLAAASVSVFLVDALDAAINDRVFIGADGMFPADQLQYLAWATDAGHNGLIANLFAINLGGHVFLHPMWLLTGLLHVGAGLSYPLLMLSWKAATLLALFVALRAYARMLLGADDRTIAVAMMIALFMVSPMYLISGPLHNAVLVQVNIELFSVWWVNGYLPIALCVVAMIAFLIQCERLVSGDDASRSMVRRTLIASAAGLVAAWLHPWQGLTLIVIIAGLVAWERPSLRRHGRLLIPVLATAVPIVYYAVLARVDPGWAYSQRITSGWNDPVGWMVVAVLPIAILMLPGYAGRTTSSGERMLRLWPVAIAVVYIVSPSAKFEDVAGLSVPAALLMVRGWPWVRTRLPRWSRAQVKWLAVAGICVAVGAAPVAIVRRVTAFRSGAQNDAEIARGDARALDQIAALRVSGGVLTTAALGSWVPAVTGHPTWVGHPVWTPAYDSRDRRVSALFSGSLDRDPGFERVFVRSTGARFVLEPCGSRAHLDPALLGAGWGVVRVGCATLYTSRG